MWCAYVATGEKLMLPPLLERVVAREMLDPVIEVLVFCYLSSIMVIPSASSEGGEAAAL
jgi:hypothetical protein